ncbi:MAG: hypothetical protein ACOX0G_02995 [Patescibacteria group bacterium]
MDKAPPLLFHKSTIFCVCLTIKAQYVVVAQILPLAVITPNLIVIYQKLSTSNRK